MSKQYQRQHEAAVAGACSGKSLSSRVVTRTSVSLLTDVVAMLHRGRRMPPNLIVRSCGLQSLAWRTYSFAAKKASGQTSGILDPEKGCVPAPLNFGTHGSPTIVIVSY